MALVKKTLFVFTSLIVISFSSLVKANQALADTVECGEFFNSADDSCNCDFEFGVIERRVGVGMYQTTVNRCCGWPYRAGENDEGVEADEFQCLAFDPSIYEEDELDALGRRPVNCGAQYNPNTHYCTCANSETYVDSSAGMGAHTTYYCCGWYNGRFCSASAEGTSSPFELCAQIRDPDMKAKCEACTNQASDDPQVGGEHIWTAVGCIPTNYKGLVSTVIKIGVGVAGGFTFLMILAGSFMLTLSQGEPKKITEAKDMITSAIIGLIFIIFSVSILQLIGVQIFKLPGFV